MPSKSKAPGGKSTKPKQANKGQWESESDKAVAEQSEESSDGEEEVDSAVNDESEHEYDDEGDAADVSNQIIS